jgi:D-alanyl-lipoteichoic acid acyltransferase DltB (MBOAT superfamily)
MADFWRRWHISLSTWLRDYLYISLGGNRKGKYRTYLNLLITMLLGGLWHGASFKFVVWGGLHGIVLIFERWLGGICRERLPKLRLPRVIGIIITFHVVCLLWIFFRADTMDIAISFIYRIFSNFETSIIADIAIAYLPVFAVMLIAYIVHFLPSQFKEYYGKIFAALPIGIKIVLIVLLVFLMRQMSAADTQPFIYFQF